MRIEESWQLQREALRAALKNEDTLSGAVGQVRHALLQTEQNALAGMSDDILRQQAGVLFSSLKTSIGLLETPVAAKTWVAQSAKAPKSKQSAFLWSAVALMQAASGLLCFFKGEWLGFALVLASFAVALAALFTRRGASPAKPMTDDIRVTLQPDAERLLMMLDAQTRAIDRFLNDFEYLNDQLRGGAECTDSATLAHVAALLEALYECDGDGEGVATAREAAQEMLEKMGLRALDYKEEHRGFFTALPSKFETRTLSPAIITAEDRRLLRRGTAAVQTDVA